MDYFSLFPLVCASITSLIAYQYWRSLQFVHFMPGLRPLLSPLSPFGMLLPNHNLLNPGSTWYWSARNSSYLNKTHDIISIVPLLGSVSYYTCSFDVMKQILSADIRLQIEKPYDMTLERLFGPSLASVNGESWRRHRRVVQPAFSNKLYESIGNEVAKIYQSMMESEDWRDCKQIDFLESHDFMLKFTLCIISKCGFGIDASWNAVSSSEKPETHLNHVQAQHYRQNGFTLPEALRIVSQTLIPRIILPNWVYAVPIERLQRMGESWNDLSSYIRTAINDKDLMNPVSEDGDTQDPRECSKDNLLTRLVTSWTLSKSEKHSLSENEVIGNMYTLMFAGHETTASALVSVFALLAIHQDIQEKAFNEITVMQAAQSSESKNIDVNKMTFTKFCLWEALRLYPSANFLPRELTQDMAMDVQMPGPQKVILQKGSWIMFDLISIFRNPHTFPQPNDFKPERWNGIAEHEVGMFGVGPRACIGRKFAQVEALHILSMILTSWKIDILTRPNENRKMYKERVLNDAGQVGTAFGLRSVPLRLIRRF
ncbi:cytochrome P450 [Lentinula edodes]|uniref:Cytochrome P450 n=1 Tax=Lentinula edodes TaxID=5353 RepID=A0A1Q3E030_LENED|nr:cytochrome P450 [Lentinula edodes]